MAVRIIVNTRDALTRIGRLRRGVRPIALRIAGGVLFRSILRNFDRQRTPWGGFWRRLRLRQGRPLVKTGRLRASITMIASAAGILIRAGVPYASVQQHGAVIRPKNASGRLKFTEDGRFYSLRSVTIPSRAYFPIIVGTDRVAIPATVDREMTEAVDRELERIFNTA